MDIQIRPRRQPLEDPVVEPAATFKYEAPTFSWFFPDLNHADQVAQKIKSPEESTTFSDFMKAWHESVNADPPHILTARQLRDNLEGMLAQNMRDFLTALGDRSVYPVSASEVRKDEESYFLDVVVGYDAPTPA